MSPEHHEERLRVWALRTGRPVLSIDYGKAPECELCHTTRFRSLNFSSTDPYPYAIDEAFDVYRVLVESAGTVIGMSGRKLNIIVSGDSAYAPSLPPLFRHKDSYITAVPPSLSISSSRFLNTTHPISSWLRRPHSISQNPVRSSSTTLHSTSTLPLGCRPHTYAFCVLSSLRGTSLGCTDSRHRRTICSM
jgi:hypothetical protein